MVYHSTYYFTKSSFPRLWAAKYQVLVIQSLTMAFKIKNALKNIFTKFILKIISYFV